MIMKKSELRMTTKIKTVSYHRKVKVKAKARSLLGQKKNQFQRQI
jgi:acylphosphatase